MSDSAKKNREARIRRHRRVRKKVKGTAERPRLSVYRSNLHIYAQLIDDDAQVTLAAASSNDKDADVKYGGNVAAASAVGKNLAAKAKAKGITQAAFDRGHYRFHGRVKALARAATEAGVIERQDAGHLESAWIFASRVRNQIMLMRGRGSDSLPHDTRELASVAELMGYGPGEASHLLADYRRVTRRARVVVDRLFWGLS